MAWAVPKCHGKILWRLEFIFKAALTFLNSFRPTLCLNSTGMHKIQWLSQLSTLFVVLSGTMMMCEVWISISENSVMAFGCSKKSPSLSTIRYPDTEILRAQNNCILIEAEFYQIVDWLVDMSVLSKKKRSHCIHPLIPAVIPISIWKEVSGQKCDA